MRNLIFCVAGVAVGFLVGFYAANTISRQPTGAAASASRPAARAGSPPQTATGAQLPPDHPDIGGAGSATGAAAPAPPSPEAQAAADAADSSPRDFAAQFKAAETFYRLKDYPKAEQYAARAADLKPDDFKAHVLLGNSRYDRRDFPGAAASYERALAINSKAADVRTDYGNTFFLREPPDLDRAVAEYRKSLELDPRHEQSLMNLTSALIQKKDKKAALEALARLEAANPRHPSLATLRQSAEALP